MTGRLGRSSYIRILLAGPAAIALAMLVAFLLGFWTSTDPVLNLFGRLHIEQVYNTTLFFPSILMLFFFFAAFHRSLKRVAAIMLAVALLSAVPLMNAVKLASQSAEEEPSGRAARAPVQGAAG